MMMGIKLLAIKEITKVKAHLSREHAAAAGEGEFHRGNDKADSCAGDSGFSLLFVFIEKNNYFLKSYILR